MGFLLEAAMKAAAAPVEPVQLDLTLPPPPVVLTKVAPPRHYRVNDRMLSPRFFNGTVEGTITADGKFEGETVVDPPPPGTMMRFKWHRFDGDRFASGSVVVLAELLAFEAWEIHRSEIAREEHTWQNLVDRAIDENEARDFNASLRIPVRWQPAEKIALNAMYDTGAANGRRRNSVDHVQVMEPLTIGRIKREAKDLLCGAKPGREGLSTTGPYWFSKDSDPIL
ncbi:hypothetical protein SAMN05216338_1001843 [Bradyrhizobium sp. Rc2d]|uniref:hypothetical protein n=1 Tax=Bradyrhizobium sp. Rc2d TaxID=1855321 RepID=UPI000888C6EE|nr:hypothetical protein [Bradyrhizobium sp. Rc2d]SDG59378.1 hypothetical protein SAMN05216338_1001843 [Bradyrhizobium sp. Rc2d]